MIYVVVYLLIFFMCYWVGIVIKEMFVVLKVKFVMVGVLEVLGIVMGMVFVVIFFGVIIFVLV